MTNIEKFEAHMKANGAKNSSLQRLVDGEYRWTSTREKWNTWQAAVATAHQYPNGLALSDYEACLASHRKVVRDLDMIINGDAAAQQASLIDLLPQVSKLVENQLKWRNIRAKPPRTGQWILWYTPRSKIQGLETEDMGFTRYTKAHWNDSDMWIPLSDLKFLARKSK